METSEIKDILERYWKCETSLEEERFLKAFFSQEGIPSGLSAYTSFFELKNELSKVTTPVHLIKKMEEAAGNTVSMKRKTFSSFYPVLRIAASVLIVISVGIGIQTQYNQEKYLDELMSDTYTNPEDAVQDVREVLGKVSSTLSKSQNLLLDVSASDSLSENQELDKR